MIFDTHIHLDRCSSELNVAAEVEAARQAGVSQFLLPGVDQAGWQNIQAIADRFDGVQAAFGLHPQAADQWNQDCRNALITFLREEKAVAIGEIGLDRTIDVPMALQEQVFREQLQIAIEFSLPVLIHCRKVPGRLLEILREEKADQVGGIMHAFGGSYQTARSAIDLGFVLSFGGALTYPEARRAIEVVRQLPDDALVVETDAPDLAPHPHRGEPNRPLWISLVVQRLAEIRGWSFEQTVEITTANAQRVLQTY